MKRSDNYMPTNIDHSVRRNICTTKTAVCRNIWQTGVDWKSLEDSLVCAEMVERFRSSLLSSLISLSNLCCCFSVLSLLFHCHTRLAPAKVFCEHQDCVIYAEIVSSTLCSFPLLILQLGRHANGCCSFLAYVMQTYENWQIQWQLCGGTTTKTVVFKSSKNSDDKNHINKSNQSFPAGNCSSWCRVAFCNWGRICIKNECSWCLVVTQSLPLSCLVFLALHQFHWQDYDSLLN